MGSRAKDESGDVTTEAVLALTAISTGTIVVANVILGHFDHRAALHGWQWFVLAIPGFFTLAATVLLVLDSEWLHRRRIRRADREHHLAATYGLPADTAYLLWKGKVSAERVAALRALGVAEDRLYTAAKTRLTVEEFAQLYAAGARPEWVFQSMLRRASLRLLVTDPEVLERHLEFLGAGYEPTDAVRLSRALTLDEAEAVFALGFEREPGALAYIVDDWSDSLPPLLSYADPDQPTPLREAAYWAKKGLDPDQVREVRRTGVPDWTVAHAIRDQGTPVPA